MLTAVASRISILVQGRLEMTKLLHAHAKKIRSATFAFAHMVLDLGGLQVYLM